MARTTTRAICTLPGHDLSHRREGRDRRRRSERRLPAGNQKASAAPAGYGLHPGGRTKITVRTFVSLMCRDHPEWTSNNRDAQGYSHTPTVGGSWEGMPAQRHFPDARARVETGRRTSPQADRKDAINEAPANRTRVRAKMRVVVIRKHSREEMKKAS
ncbi:hypothetical protein ACIA5D_48940 [Actinoplanes sp. NPDC051513]|uniref:hypothetical protein n=1 Tax=Actinoplanes sp. NPDC051513 TaxID=3363908 RepID=UPI003797B3A2